MKSPGLTFLGFMGLLALSTSTFASDGRGGVSGGGGSEGGVDDGDQIEETTPEEIVIRCRSGELFVIKKEFLPGNYVLTDLIRQVCAGKSH
jgi:hypothetical protein